MLKKLGVMLVAGLLFAVTGCGDDVKKTTVKQEVQESEPQMVEQGEMVVE